MCVGCIPNLGPQQQVLLTTETSNLLFENFSFLILERVVVYSLRLSWSCHFKCWDYICVPKHLAFTFLCICLHLLTPWQFGKYKTLFFTLCPWLVYVVVVKYSGKKQLRQEKIYFSPQFQVAVIYCGKVKAGTLCSYYVQTRVEREWMHACCVQPTMREFSTSINTVKGLSHRSAYRSPWPIDNLSPRLSPQVILNYVRLTINTSSYTLEMNWSCPNLGCSWMKFLYPSQIWALPFAWVYSIVLYSEAFVYLPGYTQC